MSQQVIYAPIGIDLGSWTSKVAVAKRGGVEIITNEANFRETPCVVGYGPTERHIGESGNIKMKSNFKDTVAFPQRFLGLSPDNPFLKAEKKFCSAKCINKDHRIAFDIKYQGQSQTLYPQQIMAAYMNKLRLIIQKNNIENKSAVIAVPTYLTQQERKAFLDAAKIAELQVTRLINDSTAIGLDYGMFRKADLDKEKPRNVLFIDFGHSKLSIFACNFTQTEMNVLEQEYCRHIGCRDIDYHLYQFYRGVFQKSSGGNDLAESRKAIVKLMENIERQRKILSGNSEHDLNIECLMEGEDLQYTMTREQFEKISEPIFNAVAENLTKVRQTLKARGIILHSIELIGGGSRIPAFVNLVRNIFGVEASRTLNSNQSVARGCALMAAIKSPLFKVPDYTLNEKSNYGIKMYWNFVEGEKYLGLDSSLYPEKQGKYIYEIGAKVPSNKTIKFTRKEAIEILLEYEPYVNGFNKHIGYYRTKAQNPKEQTFGVNFKIKFNQDGLVTFDDCSLAEEWFEETKIPKKKQPKKEDKKDQKKQEKDQSKPVEPQKMEEEEFDIKKTKKQRFTAIKYDADTFENFSAKEIEGFFSIESTMMNQDKHIIETYEKKNELESLAYSWKEKIQSSHSGYINPNDVHDLVKFLESQSEWLYSEGHDSTRGAYNERIEAVRNKINPILKRYDNFDHLTHNLENLEKTLKTNFDFLNSLDKKYEHISPEDRQEGIALIERVRGWVINAHEKQKLKPRWEDTVISIEQVKQNSKEVVEKAKKIMSKPVPAPPKVEEKKEENKEEKMDIESEAKPEPSTEAPQGEKMAQ